MGGGASSKKKKYADAAPTGVSSGSLGDSEDGSPKAEAGEKKLTRFQQIKAQADAKEKESEANGMKPCERCGVSGRRTTRMGANTPWLCSACSMSQGPAAALERPRAGQLSAAAQNLPSSAIEAASTGSNAPRAQVVPRAARRKGAKGFANRPKDADGAADDRPQRQSMAGALPAPGAQKGDRRSQQPQEAASRASANARSSQKRGSASDSAPVGSFEPWPGSGIELLDGWKVGDAVQCLVSRARLGLPVLEAGQEGSIICLSPFHGLADGIEPRFLIQFSLGFDWTLTVNQICHPAYFASNRSQSCAGGLDWGARVRSLVVLLEQSAGEQGNVSLTLGDAGVVLGPGHTKGKLAVRFDTSGEWNIWPSALCREDRFDKVIDERLAGGYRRGDFVQTNGFCTGTRAGKPLVLDPGEVGMVIGPGHSSGRLLVFIESSDRPWSLLPNQVVRLDDDGPAAASVHPAVPGAVAEICF